MGKFELSAGVNANNIFLVNFSALADRYDPAFHKGMPDVSNFIKLSTVASVKGGKRIPLGKTYSSTETPYLYLRVTDAGKDGEVDFASLNFIDEDVFQELRRYEIHEGQLAISIAGTIGRVFLLENAPLKKRIILTENCAKIILKNEAINPRYFSLVLNLPIVQKQFELNYIQTTIPKLGLDRIKNLYLPTIPDWATQKKIMSLYHDKLSQKQQKEKQAQALLDGIDAYLLTELGITLPEEDNCLEKRMFTVPFSEATSGRLDPYYFKEHFSHFFKSLEKSKYKVLPLGKISQRITSGITPLSGGDAYTTADNGIPFIRSGNININGDLDFSDLLYLQPSIHNAAMKSSKLKKNDLMIAIVGATIGQVGIYLDDREANINQAIALVRLNAEINHNYVKELIKSGIGQMSLNRLKRPVARANINLEEISTMQIVLPPIEKQNEIAAHISNIRAQAKQLRIEAAQILAEAKAEIERMILGEPA